MPSRKLNPQDVDELADAYAELANSRPRGIVRTDDKGSDIEIRTNADLARWKDISSARFYELSRNGFKLKSGVPREQPETVSADTAKTMVGLMLAQVKERDDRIRELEAEVAVLRKQLKENRK